MAKRAGVTNSTVSLIEQESHAPSLASLHRILTAIPISLADFFALPVSQKNALFYDAKDLAVVSRGVVDLRVLGSERRDKKLQLFIERYEPGAGTGEEPIVYEGETAAVVIKGTIEVEAKGEVRRHHGRWRLPVFWPRSVSLAQCRQDGRHCGMRLYAAHHLTFSGQSGGPAHELRDECTEASHRRARE